MKNHKNHTVTIDRVSEITGLTRAALYRAAALAELGSPAHFIYDDGIIRYTLRGLCRIAAQIQREREFSALTLTCYVSAYYAACERYGIQLPEEAAA
jgi:hypothetical protein